MFYIPIIVSLFSLLFVFFLARQIKKIPEGSRKIFELSIVRTVIKSFLGKEYRAISFFALLLFFFFWLKINFLSAFSFFTGVIISFLVGYFGAIFFVSVKDKVSGMINNKLNEALNLAFQGGLVNGFLAAGFSLLSVSLLYLITKDSKPLIAFCLGAFLTPVFTRLTNSVCFKKAQLDTDLGLTMNNEKENFKNKNYTGFLIIDEQVNNVKENMGIITDFFATQAVVLIIGILAGLVIFENSQIAILPLILSSAAILVFIITVFFFKIDKSQDSIVVFYKILIASALLLMGSFYFILRPFSELKLVISVDKIFLSSFFGFMFPLITILIVDYFFFKNHNAKDTDNYIFFGYSRAINNLKTFPWPVMVIGLSLVFCYWLAGFYGLIVSVFFSLSLIPLVLAINVYDQIIRDTGKALEITNFDRERKKTGYLLEKASGAINNIVKLYDVLAVSLLVVVVVYSYVKELENEGIKIEFFLQTHKIIISFFVGALLPYFFSSYIFLKANKVICKTIDGVKECFKEKKSLRSRINFHDLFSLSQEFVVKEMMGPFLIPIFLPILIGLLLGPEFLAGFLIGAIVFGLFLTFLMTFTFNFWNKTKSFILGRFFFKTKILAAPLVNDLSNFSKENVGLALNSMIKVLNIVALLIINFLV